MTAVEQTFRGQSEKNERFNFVVLVGDVTCFFIGMGFLDGGTALPALVEKLGGGATFMGFLLAARQGCYFFPQLFVAHKLHHRTTLKPFLLKVTLGGRLGFWLAALFVWQFGVSQPGLALASLAAAYVIGWLCDGAGGVPWTALVGRTVSGARRGRLFATTQVLSGFSRIAVGGAVAALLGGRVVPFPHSGGLLVLGCAVFLLISWIFLALLREPEATQTGGDEIPDPIPLSAYLRELPAKFKTRPDIARLAAVQILAGAAGSSAPFLTLAATEKGLALPTHLPFGLSGLLDLLPSGGLPGLFLIAQTVGLLLFAPVWGTLTDKYGPRVSLLCLVGFGFFAPLIGLWSISGQSRLVTFLVAFVLFGAVVDGWMTITNYLLEAVSDREQTAYVGLMNAASVPALLIPFMCGLAYHSAGPPAAFILCAFLLVVCFGFAWSLPPTRGDNSPLKTVQ